MKKLKIKDLSLRKLYFQKELQNKALKYTIIRCSHDTKFKKIKNLILNFKKKQKGRYSKTQLVRRCVLTGRARGSVRLFGISRMALRDMLGSGVVPGYKKCVW
jgi:small subunit ribosomal protein S14